MYLTLLIKNIDKEILEQICEICFFHVNLSSIFNPKNLMVFSSNDEPTRVNGVLFMCIEWDPS